MTLPSGFETNVSWSIFNVSGSSFLFALEVNSLLVNQINVITGIAFDFFN